MRHFDNRLDTAEDRIREEIIQNVAQKIKNAEEITISYNTEDNIEERIINKENTLRSSRICSEVQKKTKERQKGRGNT